MSKLNSKSIIIVCSVIVGLLAGFVIAGYKRNEPKYIQTPDLENQASATNKINYDNVAKVVVVVIARFGNLNNQRFGCGVVYNDNGYIITNRHIIENLDHAFISVNGKEIKAKVIGSHKELDIAVLKAEADNDLMPAQFADSSKIRIGQQISVIGKPFAKKESYTVTSGVVSSLPFDLPKGWPTLLAVDAVVNPGNSGGAVVDENGNVIAITTAYQSTGTQTQGLGFAIPIDNVIKAAEEILKNE